MRILVLGCSGSGKSTLSRSLGQTLDIPVFQMDKLFWKENWVESSDEELAEKLEEIVALKDWIIDGNFSRFLPHRLERTEEIIYINLPRWQNLWRVTKRYLQYRGQTRPDMGDGCNEKLDLEFLLPATTNGACFCGKDGISAARQTLHRRAALCQYE